MRTRQPADQRRETTYSRRTGPLARSPAERMEPTRPPTRPRLNRHDGEPRRASPMVRFLNGLLTFVLVLMVVIGSIAFAFDAKVDAPGPLQRPKTVVIPKGEGAHEIGARLEREGVVSDRRLFVAEYLRARLSAQFAAGKPPQLRAGDYAVKQQASIRQVLELLSEGRTISYRVTVPEGLTSHQIVERLKADNSLSGEVDAVPGEGSLLPDTYVVEHGMPRQAVLERMQAEGRKFLEKAWQQRKQGLPLKSLEEAMVLASIVEKETGRNDERERVAAVFVNRLKQSMRLQSDPTILYGISGGRTNWGRPIQKQEIGQKTAHNTYQIDGLPPTPICNPGRAAVEAVLNPADTKELYFVADGSGGHHFAETLKEHNANVQRWRVMERDIRAKAAPSPTAAEAPATPADKAPKQRAVVRTVPAKAPPADKSKEPISDPAKAKR